MLKPVESAVGSKGNGGVVTVETVATTSKTISGPKTKNKLEARDQTLV